MKTLRHISEETYSSMRWMYPMTYLKRQWDQQLTAPKIAFPQALTPEMMLNAYTARQTTIRGKIE